MEKLRSIIEDSDTRPGRMFDHVIQALIVISLISFTLETMPDVAKSWQGMLSFIEAFIVIVFTIEYILRIAVTKNSLRYIFSFYGVIDLVAILPFYISTNVDLRTVRLFRLLRLFRILKLTRYSEALLRMRKAITIAADELVIFSILTLILLYLAGVGIYYFENEAQPDKFRSIVDSLWWAVATLTTVGYGDIYPITVGGRIFTFFILMIGLGIVAVPTGIVSSALSVVREKDREK